MLRHAEKTIGNLISKQKFAFIASVDQNGYPNIKSMLLPRKIEGIHTFYFSTNTSSMRVQQYRENPKASIYFADFRFYRGVMLVGNIEVLESPIYKEMLWEKGDTQYYPKGVTDPDYCVLKFTANSGRYYANFKSETFAIPSAKDDF